LDLVGNSYSIPMNSLFKTLTLISIVLVGSFSHTAFAQTDFSVLYFRTNLKDVQSYDIYIGDKKEFTAERNGHIKFVVYGDAYLDIKVVETLPNGDQRTLTERIRLKRYYQTDVNGKQVLYKNVYYWRTKKGKRLNKWSFGNYAKIGSKYLTRINVYNENGRIFTDRFDQESIPDNDSDFNEYDFTIKPDNYNLIKSINSTSDEYFPMVNPSATMLYFTSKRKSQFGGEGNENLYTVPIYESGFGKVTLLPEPLNSTKNEGSSSFTGDGQTIVFSRCGDTDGIGNCDIYMARFNGTNWEEPHNMGQVINSSKWDAQPSISADGTKLVFASNRSGGIGKEDIYISYKDTSGNWGIPQNLGNVINTSDYEKSPFLAADGRTLYFSSSGHGGAGKADMFKSVLINGVWSQPVNMGSKINTPYDDLFFTTSASGEYAFFASKRPEGQGGFDIYQFGLPEHLKPTATTIVRGTVWDAEQNPIPANIIVQDLTTGDVLTTTTSHPQTGKYTVTLPSGRNYSMIVNSERRFFNSQNFRLESQIAYEEINRNITLEEIKKGAKARLNNIFFDTGKSNLTLDSRIDLNRIVKLMQENPTMIIQIGGHTDNTGNDATNLSLSLKRAKAVKRYLTDASIASERIDTKGYGASEPFTTNLTEEGRALNRRTEFLILDN